MVRHQEKMVTVRSGQFQVQLAEGGRGDSLLYLHGATAYTGWPPFLDQLARHFHVYAPAHPGVSRSNGLEHLDDLWDLVLFYEELMQSLRLEKAHVIGHCYGGMLAAELAAHCPDRVARLVLVAPLGLWLEDTPIADFFVLTPTERAKALWYDANSPAAIASLAPPEDPTLRMESDLDRTQTLAAVGKFIWPIPDRGLTKRIHRITTPTLLLWGDSDGVVPPVYGKAFQQLLANSTLKLIEACGHLPQEEREPEFLDAVLGFLRN